MSLGRSGFGYITAVLILGLLAFMGLFLIQSSSTEYSQAAMSCYATMAQQLAEAACDEAFLQVEKELKGLKKGPLLRQAKLSELPYNNNGGTGLNPTLTDFLPDYKGAAAQTSGILLTHLTRPGIEIESILPSLTDLRPIDHGDFADEECVYRSKDWPPGVDRKMSRDFLLSVTLTAKVALKIGGKKHRFQFQQTRDLKVINVGPVAQAYTLFSCVGVDPRVQDDIYNDLNMGRGRLVLWNIPFQSRLYIHGPAVIGLENPDRLEPGDEDGAFIINKPDVYPGSNQAFQYSDTYAGLSYMPYPGRALWQKRSMFGGAHKNDLAAMTADEQRMFKHNTYIKKGYIPKLNQRWSELSDYFNFGKDFVRGNYKKQVFLPAGPYCRFPWKFVEDRPATWNNQTSDSWPYPNPDLKIEHRWLKSDSSMEKNTKIYGEVKQHRLFQALTYVGTWKQGGYPKLQYPEFALSYGNPRDSEGVLDSIFILTENVFKTFWETISVGPRLAYIGAEALVRLVIKPKDPNLPQPVGFNKPLNFYPSNFKNFPKSAIIKLRDVSEIPKENGIWILDGVYWLDYFQTTAPVKYKGKGIIFVGDYVPSKPFTIGGSILRFLENDNPGDNHLTLVYYPLPGDGRLPDDPSYLNECQMVINGKGVTIEASVFSLAGIRSGSADSMSTDGILSDQDYLRLNMDPMKVLKEWNVDFRELSKSVNSICGNYVTYFMKKRFLNSDLWVFHDNSNPFYFDGTTKQLKQVYNEVDEVMAHTVHLSPKIQHMAFSGAGGE